MEFTTRYEFWLDTNPNDPGPEYRVDALPNTEVIPLQKVANFASGGIDLVLRPAGAGGRERRGRDPVRQDHRPTQLHGHPEQGAGVGGRLL